MQEDNPANLHLSQEELDALPEKVRNYIFALQRDLISLAQQGSSRKDDELRRKRYAYWKR